MTESIKAAASVFLLLASMLANAADPGKTLADGVLFEDVRIFDGKTDGLSNATNVLVIGNTISQISSDPIQPPADLAVTRIDGSDRTLMPGLIDAHVHMIMSNTSLGTLMTAEPNYVMLKAGQGAGEMLMRGVTSVRDLGGPSFGLKRAIDDGVLPGPRIWPSGATISQTSGHGDFRSASHDIPAGPSRGVHFTERLGFTSVADGRPEVLRAVREQLMKGASQIKIMAGGGVASDYDPIDVTQYSQEEMRAAVEAAASWNTYVTVHAYTPKAIQQAIQAGVKCIDHAQLADEETARLSAEKGVWWSMQPFLDDEDATPFPEGSANRKKQLEMTAGTDTAYKLAREYDIKLAWGTDTLFDPELAKKQGKQLAKMERWFTPFEILRMATSRNAQLLALSGPRSPYSGKLGVVEQGALADLLLVDGNPLEDLSLVADPETNFIVIMKDGRVYKNVGGF